MIILAIDISTNNKVVIKIPNFKEKINEKKGSK